MFWQATGLKNLTDSCDPDNTMGNEYSAKRKQYFNHGNHDIRKTCSLPNQWELHFVHDCESSL